MPPTPLAIDEGVGDLQEAAADQLMGSGHEDVAQLEDVAEPATLEELADWASDDDVQPALESAFSTQAWEDLAKSDNRFTRSL